VNNTFKFKLVAALVVILVGVIGGFQLYSHRHFDTPLVASKGVTEVKKLSDYYDGLEGSFADTRVFVLKGEEKGGKALVIGNSHPSEPVSALTSFLIIENATVEKGTIYVIPSFNRSASRYTKPGDGYPLYYNISTPWGKKKFRMGNRGASPLEQWPDPSVYIHYPSKQMLSYQDARNINRTWPGRPNGPLMEQVTYSAMELIREENVDVAIDIHGAETMFPVTNCFVVPSKSRQIATLASLNVQAQQGFENHIEPSPPNFHGLSHREIADHSDAMPFLIEAPEPFLDQPTGPKTTDLLLDGKDPFLLSLSKQGRLYVPYDKTGWPMKERVGQQSSLIQETLRQFSKTHPGSPISMSGVPEYKQIVENGIGYYYHNPEEASEDRVYMQ